MMFEVTAKVLNFRTGPGTNHRIIRGLERGTLLEVFGSRLDWLQVRDMSGVEGWVHKAYVQPYNAEQVNPVEYWIGKGWRLTSPYGPRTGRYEGFHRGVDMGGKPCGYKIEFPFRRGKVVAARTSGMGTWGNTVCVELSPDFVTLNAHLQRISVKVGQELKQGDVIGLNGGSNHSGANYACHIHFEILNNNGSAPWRGTIWGDPQKFKF